MKKALKRISVGGLKIQEEGACVVSSFSKGGSRLGVEITAPMAQNRINLSFLTYLAGSRVRSGISVLCTKLTAGLDCFSLLQRQKTSPGALQLNSGDCIIAVYPHNQRPEIMGQFLGALAQAKVRIHGLASSPSAFTAVISTEARGRAITQLFRHFQFSSFASPAEFYAAQRPPEELVRQVVAAYQEKVTRIYCLTQKADLDLWELSIPTSMALQELGAMLTALGDRGGEMPFLLAVPWLEKEELLVSFGISSRYGDDALNSLKHYLPGVAATNLGPAAAIFIHGPHFGDRYGVADTLVQALDKAQVPLVALSCTVSSISVAVKQRDLAAAVKVLGETFETPAPVCARPKERK